MSGIYLFDVDGTLTDASNRLIPGIIPRLRNLVEGGNTVALASGNVIPYMVSLRTFLGINGPVFGENGGIVYHRNQLQLFGNKDRPRMFFQKISDAIRIDEMFSNKWREVSMAFRIRDGTELPSSIVPDPEIELTYSGFAWHILNRGLNKGMAVKFLVEAYECDRSDVTVFGDSDNDVPMMENGTNGITFSRAHPSLRKKAAHIINTDREDWIIEALDSLDDLH